MLGRNPIRALEVAASDADKALTWTGTGSLNAGEVLVLDSEQMLVEQIVGSVATVRRAWNGTALGTQWNFSCGVQASAASVVDNRSSGTGSVYVTNSFSGGTYSFSSGPWCTNGPCAGTTTLTVEQVTLQYVSGVAFSSVLNLNTSGHFNNSNCNLTFAIANGYGIGDTDNNSADPTYPALLDSNCGATRQYGAWSNIITITARIDCPVASKTSTWGQLKTLYR